MIKSWFFFIYFSFVIKKDNKRNGIVKLSIYNIMYGIVESGFVFVSVIIVVNIGLVYGVYFVVNVILIKMEFKNLFGLCLKWIFCFFIIVLGWNMLSVMKLNNIISNVLIC